MDLSFLTVLSQRTKRLCNEIATSAHREFVHAREIVAAIRTKRSNARDNHIKKRHWCLGSFVILTGSWITHSTTATIEGPASPHHRATQKVTILEDAIANDQYGTDMSNTLSNNPIPAGDLNERIEQQALYENDLLADLPAGAQVSNVNSNHDNSSKTSERNEAEESLTTKTHTVRKGESLGSIFGNYKFDLAIAHHVSRHDVADSLVALSIGRTLTFKHNDEKQLKQIRYPVNALQELVVNLDGVDVDTADIVDLPYQMSQYSISGEIKSSLYEAALEAGLSISLVMEMVRIFGWDIDFVLDLRSGDHFHVIYEDFMMNGEKLADGHILAAEFTTQGQTHRAIRFADEDGNFSYYTPAGESMLGTFLRSPVEFSRISSRFGKRKHPISKKWKAHKGVDYAASRGVPIRATADGKVIHAGRKGGYGNTIILRHAGRFTTLYAHMNGFAKGMRTGQRVKQGDTIGYVGTTGYSTGPHLHYEFRFDGIHRNPLTYKTPKASSVKPELKTQFLDVARRWERELDKSQENYLYARAKSTVSEL